MGVAFGPHLKDANAQAKSRLSVLRNSVIDEVHNPQMAVRQTCSDLDQPGLDLILGLDLRLGLTWPGPQTWPHMAWTSDLASHGLDLRLGLTWPGPQTWPHMAWTSDLASLAWTSDLASHGLDLRLGLTWPGPQTWPHMEVVQRNTALGICTESALCTQ